MNNPILKKLWNFFQKLSFSSEIKIFDFEKKKLSKLWKNYPGSISAEHCFYKIVREFIVKQNTKNFFRSSMYICNCNSMIILFYFVYFDSFNFRPETISHN